MRKNKLLSKNSFLFFLTFICVSLFLPQSTHAQVSTSCWTTDFGNPDADIILPPECKSTLAKVPLYKQWDSRWGRLPYGSCGTLSSSACGSTSLAMVISYYLGKELSPKESARLSVANGWRVCGMGTLWAAMIGMPKLHGLNSKAITWTEAKRNLSFDPPNPIIQSQGPGYFTSKGHFIVITGILPNGKYSINDPDGRHRTEATEAQITASNKAQWLIYK